MRQGRARWSLSPARAALLIIVGLILSAVLVLFTAWFFSAVAAVAVVVVGARAAMMARGSKTGTAWLLGALAVGAGFAVAWVVWMILTFSEMD